MKITHPAFDFHGKVGFRASEGIWMGGSVTRKMRPGSFTPVFAPVFTPTSLRSRPKLPPDVGKDILLGGTPCGPAERSPTPAGVE